MSILKLHHGQVSIPKGAEDEARGTLERKMGEIARPLGRIWLILVENLALWKEKFGVKGIEVIKFLH